MSVHIVTEIEEIVAIPDLSSNKGITLIHWNARSMYNKLDEVIHLLEDSDCEIMCISESWLTPDIDDEMILHQGYSIYRSDRDEKSGKTRG